MEIKKLFTKYDDNSKFLSELEVKKQKKVLSFVLGYLISLIILLSPIIFTAQFFIYSFYFNFVAFVLIVEIVLFFLLGEVFNHKLLIYFSGYEGKKKLLFNHTIDGIVYLILCLIGYFIIIKFIRK